MCILQDIWSQPPHLFTQLLMLPNILQKKVSPSSAYMSSETPTIGCSWQGDSVPAFLPKEHGSLSNALTLWHCQDLQMLLCCAPWEHLFMYLDPCLVIYYFDLPFGLSPFRLSGFLLLWFFFTKKKNSACGAADLSWVLSVTNKKVSSGYGVTVLCQTNLCCLSTGFWPQEDDFMRTADICQDRNRAIEAAQ